MNSRITGYMRKFEQLRNPKAPWPGATPAPTVSAAAKLGHSGQAVFRAHTELPVSAPDVNSAALPGAGFTLVELLVVTALLGLWAIWMVPGLTRTKTQSRSFQCLNNTRQLAATFAMYTADNNSFFPPNPDDGNTTPGHNWCAGNVSGGTPGSSYTGADTFNPDVMTNFSRCLVAPYLNGDAAVFRCPADPRLGRYSGSNPSLAGRIIPAARSVSLNHALGTICATFRNGGGHSGRPTLPTDGPWLTGTHGLNKHDNPWATFGKTSDFRSISPSQLFLLADEDPYSINDGNLVVSAGSAKWIDYPATFHNRGAAFSFCDGRAELHQWKGNAIVLTSDAVTVRPVAAPADVADWSWFRDHATRLAR